MVPPPLTPAPRTPVLVPPEVWRPPQAYVLSHAERRQARPARLRLPPLPPQPLGGPPPRPAPLLRPRPPSRPRRRRGPRVRAPPSPSYHALPTIPREKQLHHRHALAGPTRHHQTQPTPSATPRWAYQPPHQQPAPPRRALVPLRRRPQAQPARASAPPASQSTAKSPPPMEATPATASPSTTPAALASPPFMPSVLPATARAPARPRRRPAPPLPRPRSRALPHQGVPSGPSSGGSSAAPPGAAPSPAATGPLLPPSMPPRVATAAARTAMRLPGAPARPRPRPRRAAADEACCPRAPTLRPPPLAVRGGPPTRAVADA